MIADPYKVLGISPSATDAELKKAYRDLSKKWHPDQNPNNTAYAEEKFKEVQEAYRQIVDAREKGTSPYGAQGGYGSGYGSGYGQGFGQSYGAGYGQGARQPYDESRDGDYQQQGYADYRGYGAFGDFFNQWQRYSEQRRAEETAGESNEERAARNYINNGYYNEALNALNGVPAANRGARWYYYAGLASQGVGDNVRAMQYARQATDLEPGNQTYAAFLQRLQNGGSFYARQNQNYGFGMGSQSSSLCLSLCMANALCALCGGRWVLCC